ncbi:histidine ammonia-lyase [Nocardia suismassiliense]|uniref:Histidine ammonia-lyase n=1 Tax=Nocardia suismassiliense TaxID=2077092 RepID=A0ABW6R2A6_9NOCA
MVQDITADIGQEITLDGYRLSLDGIVRLARNPASTKVRLSKKAQSRAAESNDMKARAIQRRYPIYGVTSGFGDSSARQISARKSAELQQNLVRFLAAGTGRCADSDVVRATMAIRANCLARGWSGVRPELIQLLVDCIQANIQPLIPERGSVGASGDLVPLSYLAALLTGTGECLYEGEIRPAAEVLRLCELRPLALEAKEGLALVNGTSFMSGFAVLALHDASELCFVGDLCTALASQVLTGNPEHFSSFVFEHKPHYGSIVSATIIRRLLGGSERQVTNGALRDGQDYNELESPIQDRYSIRCAPYVVGVLRDTIEWSRDWLTIEVNSSNDNPLFEPAADRVYSAGNFYGGHVGIAMDTLKTAVASLGDLLDRQLELVVDERYNNGLTPNLIPRLEPGAADLGLLHGFKGMQISASSLVAEALKLTMPATSFSRSTEAHNQDKVSMGTIAARDARTVVELVQKTAAIHLLALCQAADLRGLGCLSDATSRAYELIRTRSAYVAKDRPLDSDIEEVAALISSGELRWAVDGMESDSYGEHPSGSEGRL